MARSNTVLLARILNRFMSPKEATADSLQSIKAQIDACESFIDKTVRLVNEWRQASVNTDEALRDLTVRVAQIESRSAGHPPAQNATAYLDLVYRGLLNRDCDEAARKSFVPQLEQGRPLQEIVDEIMRSDEYRLLKAKEAASPT